MSTECCVTSMETPNCGMSHAHAEGHGASTSATIPNMPHGSGMGTGLDGEYGWHGIAWAGGGREAMDEGLAPPTHPMDGTGEALPATAAAWDMTTRPGPVQRGGRCDPVPLGCACGGLSGRCCHCTRVQRRGVSRTGRGTSAPPPTSKRPSEQKMSHALSWPSFQKLPQIPLLTAKPLNTPST